MTGDLRRRLDAAGSVFAVFDQQDSGCVSYGVTNRSGRWFVKTAVEPAAVASIERAIAFHAAVQHPAIVSLRRHFMADGRPVLVYPWRDGEVLYHPTVTRTGGRTDPASAMARFRVLPVPEIEHALEKILTAHVAVERAGFVASDLYDGCFLYNAAAGEMSLVDLDEYRPGPYLAIGAPSGSRRYLAPEEQTGATIDIRATVFTLGRTLRLLLDVGDEERQWRGSAAQFAVVEQATQPEPAARFATVAGLTAAWRAATRTDPGPR